MSTTDDSFEDIDNENNLDEKCVDQTEISSLLDKHEDIPRIKYEEDFPNIAYWKLYSYATFFDWICILIGLICTIICGVMLTYFCILYSISADDFIEYVNTVNNSSCTAEQRKLAEDKLSDNITNIILQLLSMGLLTLITQYASGVMFSYACLRQIQKIRQKFVEKILIQDIAWFDLNSSGQLASTFSDNLAKMEDGIGEKVPHFVYFFTIFLSGIISSLFLGWKLTLICFIPLPLSFLIMAFISVVSAKSTKREANYLSIAGTIAEEALSSIRTVVAYSGQKKELRRYVEPLTKVKHANIRKSLLDGISSGSLWFFVYGGCAVSFYFGVKYIIDDRSLPPTERQYNPKIVVAVFCNCFVSFWMFSMASPYIQIFGSACGAASQVFKVLYSEPKINTSLKRGMKLKGLRGDISFHNVCFKYPSRTNVTVLNGVSLKIESGETVAFVGCSGSGKSTCIQLLQRFYDPTSGQISIDDNEIKNYNLGWLRGRIGVVGQEPTLFATTISENIRYGKLSATQEDIERAAKRANVHTFIKSLPKGYETIVGERGALLSGGQKQRIAIARALVRNPSILLLDEATSALDTTSEAQVQAALDTATRECTTIVIAHRLSTVKNASRIFVFSEGKIVEEGSYHNLMNKRGAFYELVRMKKDNINEDNTEVIEKVSTDLTGESNETMNRRESLFFVNKFDRRPNVHNEKKLINGSVIAVLRKNKPEWLWIFAGCIASIVAGCALPTYSILLGDVIGTLAIQDDKELLESTTLICLLFILLAVVTKLASILQMYSFGVAGENLTHRIRAESFAAMLKQEIGWFDVRENGVGALCARLSSDSADIQGIAGMPIGIILLSLCNLIISNGFAIYFHWKLALILIVFVPFILVGVYFEQKILAGDAEMRDKKLQKSTGIAVEAINNIKTVMSLGIERVIYLKYMQELNPYINSSKKQSHFASFMLGSLRALLYFSFSAGIQYGVRLVIEEGVQYGTIFKVAELVIYGSWALGTAFAFAPNLQKGIKAAGRIFTLLEREPAIKNIKNASKRSWENGDIEYADVYFSYPTRSDVRILNGLNLNIPAGKKIALVGSSGCGKSTVIKLLERFYNTTAGEVCVDDVDINVMDIEHVRAQFGIVSQESDLFDRTIAENIAYGNNQKSVSMEEIIRAAKDANIHDFIVSLPLGYETRVGSKGTQLSGGQKQRIAIARALVRNPRVLLLDEATSALDNESETVVQEALERARENRTCITIAHRLTTVQNADKIYVLRRGRVEEMGTHEELIRRRGHYYHFYKLNSQLAN